MLISIKAYTDGVLCWWQVSKIVLSLVSVVEPRLLPWFLCIKWEAAISG